MSPPPPPPTAPQRVDSPLGHVCCTEIFDVSSGGTTCLQLAISCRKSRRYLKPRKGKKILVFPAASIQPVRLQRDSLGVAPRHSFAPAHNISRARWVINAPTGTFATFHDNSVSLAGAIRGRNSLGPARFHINRVPIAICPRRLKPGRLPDYPSRRGNSWCVSGVAAWPISIGRNRLTTWPPRSSDFSMIRINSTTPETPLRKCPPPRAPDLFIPNASI